MAKIEMRAGGMAGATLAHRRRNERGAEVLACGMPRKALAARASSGMAAFAGECACAEAAGVMRWHQYRRRLPCKRPPVKAKIVGASERGAVRAGIAACALVLNRIAAGWWR